MTQSTPQVKKIKDLRSTGLSLREISEKLKITRQVVEDALRAKEIAVTEKEDASPKKDTSEKKATSTAASAKGK